MDSINKPDKPVNVPDDAIDAIFGGHCLLFLGSGFSLHATNAAGTEVPSVTDLKKMLEQETGQEADDLEQAAEEYINKEGEVKLAPCCISSLRSLKLRKARSG